MFLHRVPAREQAQGWTPTHTSHAPQPPHPFTPPGIHTPRPCPSPSQRLCPRPSTHTRPRACNTARVHPHPPHPPPSPSLRPKVIKHPPICQAQAVLHRLWSRFVVLQFQVSCNFRCPCAARFCPGSCFTLTIFNKPASRSQTFCEPVSKPYRTNRILRSTRT